MVQGFDAFVGEGPAFAVKGEVVSRGGDDFGKKEGVIARAESIGDAALQVSDTFYNQRGVDLFAFVEGQLVCDEFVAILTRGFGDFFDAFGERARGDVERKLPAFFDEVVGKASGIDGEGNHGRVVADVGDPRGDHDVGFVALARGDEGDGSGLEEAGGTGEV